MSQSSRKFPQSTFLVQQPDGQLTSEQALSVLDAGLLEVLDSPDGTVASVTKPSGDIVGTSATQTLTNKTIDITGGSNTISNLAHTDLTAIGTNAHSVIDTHLASVVNPHTVTKTQVGLSNVSDDAQLKIASNLADLNNASTARENLGVEIGEDVQAQNAILADLAGLTQAADKGIYFNGATTAATFDLTAAGLALLDDENVAAQHVTLGLGDSATKDTGTGSGDVATGNHLHDAVYLNVANTTSYTPTENYHPTTKKYVDDNDFGEANTASNVGTAGIGVFKEKVASDLKFNNLKAASTKVTLALDGTNNEIDIDIAEGNIDHDSLANYADGEHRVINDSLGDGATTTLWSADKIFDQLALKSDTHSHPYLETANDLSDLDDAETARSNLGLGSAAVKNIGDAVFNADAIRSKTIKNETPNVNGQLLTFTNDDTHADDQKWKAWTYGLPQGTSTAGKVLKVPSSGTTLEWADDTGYTHPHHSGDITSVNDGDTTIGANKVTLAKMAQMATDSFLGRTTTGTGNVEVLSAGDVRTILNVEDDADVTDSANVNTAGAVMEGDYDAHTVLAATSDNTPAALTVGEQTLVGRITSGNIAALTVSQAQTLLNVEDGATADQDLSTYAPKNNPTFTGTVAIPNIANLETAVAANTLKATNVSTALSTGTVDGTSYGITSDGAANDVILAQATTSVAGLLSAAKWNEITANTLKATNAPTALSVGTNNTTELSITSDGGIDDVTLPVASTSVTGVMSSALWDKLEGIEANATTDQDLSTYALLADPDLTGTPTAPTAGVGTNTTQIATTAFVKAEFGNVDALIYKGVQDCSANPDYPAADAGHVYKCSVAGKIGGASGVDVTVGDLIICDTDSTSTGNDATVGSKWSVVQGDLSIIDNLTSTSTINALSANQGKVLKALADTKLTGTGSFAITASSVTDGATTFDKYTHPTGAGNKHIPTGGSSGEFLKYDSSGTAVWADDNDTVYTHPTSAGNKHVPAGGSSGEFLKYDSAGTAVWATDNDTVYTHPTSAGNKHIPAGGATGNFLKYDSAGTAVWADDNDTVYTHPTGAGNKHIPSGGASGNFLKYDSAGTAVWADDNDTVYTHPTSAGNKHVPTGGSSGEFLKYSSSGTAVWATDNDTVYTHPTSAGNKHIPTGGASGNFLKYDSSGTAVWADDNDTVYTHPTSAGNKHVPTGGSSGNFLKYSSSGTAVWADDNNTEYSVFTGASSGGNGTTGLAPQPDAGEEEYFLRGDSTWQEVAGTITALNNQTVNRLVSIGATTTELDGEANLTFDAATNILGVGGIVHVSTEISTPTAPADGAGGYIYTKSDGKPYWITNGESEVDLSASATGAGHTIQDEGDDLATAGDLNFVGELVTATAESGASQVTIDAKSLWLYAA
jgi:hypothetical protein